LLAGAEHRGLHAVSREGDARFVEEAAATGIDIFRIFDALNNVDQMRPAIDAVRRPARRSPRWR
jgi:pyruvate carboxylase